MAAFASLLSLGHVLDHLLQHPPRQMAVLDKAQIHSLLQNITFLQDFLEDFSLIRGDEIRAFEEKIATSAYAAQDIIEGRVVDQILEDSAAASERSSTLFCQDLHKVIEEIASMKKDVMKIKETEGNKFGQQPRKHATAGAFLRGASHSKNTMVGFHDDLIQIMDTLTENESNLHILPIVGMGGSGKTTLAKNVFDNPLIVQHFDLKAWVTISQQYSVQETLFGLLKEIGVFAGEGEENTQKNAAELGLCLHRSLFDRRYLIVMDDMWSIEAWDGIKRFFPDNNNGCRVMVTTRLSNVADHFRSCTPHQLHFLDHDQSWALFCDKVFGKESCPPHLEEVGNTIVRNCRGLPLAIVAISGLLAKSSPTLEYWDYVANDTYAALNMGGDGLCLEILYLSYKHLPVHLKPCFLYMAIFPEDRPIGISRLVKLWVAEGILKPIISRSLEEVAEDNLKDLVDRNLIQVRRYGSSNKIKSCTIHDLVSDLCLREAQKEKFLCVTKFHSLNYHSRVIDRERRLNIQRSCDREDLKSMSLLKVLKISDEEIVRLIKSRYVDFSCLMFENLLNMLESLSTLWNLQTINITGYSLSGINLPSEIWGMPQLRHLKVEDGDFYLPDPPSTNSENGGGNIVVMKNLQSVYKIRNFRCTDEVLCRVPNLKRLGITYRLFPSGLGWDYFEVYNLFHLRNLVSLSLNCDKKLSLENLQFPHSLKKLTLRKCGVCWEDLTVVGSLPHLEVLNLLDEAVKGREWNPLEGQFLELKSLQIEYSDVVEWIADSSHFPCLEILLLGFLGDLKEIPYGIGEIPTLRLISLIECSDSANSSAKKMEEEQQNLGNYDLRVRALNLGLGYGGCNE
ncbi:putative late blight resistance protein homolog R1B-17 [Henckelia pumila]|uniref:putative late blight resistance protein homolog R1B-17 n=1 Tax=Henckelia pumila TaxID=405737 RepID=UPI003C6E2E61